MSSCAATSFPFFAFLPAEIQLQIWEAAIPTSQMHIFDIHAPSPPQTTTFLSTTAPATPPRHRRTRSRSPDSSVKTTKPRGRRLPTTRTASILPTVTLHPFFCAHTLNPSGYALHSTLRATTLDAASTAARHEAAIPPPDRATVRLPSGRSVVCDNAHDVLHLRFPQLTPSSSSEQQQQQQPLTALFQALWSPALASALHTARRVALDVAAVWPALGEEDAGQRERLLQDVVFLACTLQNALEVLYLVDYSQPCGVARRLGRKGGQVGSRLSAGRGAAEVARVGDVIHGNGMVWREVFDLEGLGWHGRHHAVEFGDMFGEVVRLQQGRWFGEGEKKATFQGVRVLVAESELEGGVDSDRMDES